MKKEQYEKRLKGVISLLKKEAKEVTFEPANNWFGTVVNNPFLYAATSERAMERQLEDLKGEKRLTTFMSDLSLGELFGAKGVWETVENVMTSWIGDEKYMAEFILCLNWKSWEHAARNNNNWGRFYAVAFEYCRDLTYEYYRGDEEKTSYLWHYLD